MKIATAPPKIEHREIQTRAYRVGSKLVGNKQRQAAAAAWERWIESECADNFRKKVKFGNPII